MAAQALERPPTAGPVVSEGTLKIILCGVLSYWWAIALTFPVTNYDSQVYNLARLLVAERAGFWQAASWNSVRQVMFPWTYDAVHFPFLKLGYGFALPSFACLLGILATTYCLLSPRWGRVTALWACLTITAMPTVVLQATATKNDLAVVFALGCWLYACDRYHHTRRRIFLLFEALSLAFAVGSKTSAIPLCATCSLISLYLLRREPQSLLFFIGSYVPLLFLFGSVETYALSYHCFHNLLGPPDFIRDHANRDGLRGAVANVIRYFYGNLSLGIDGANQQSSLPGTLRKACRSTLQLFHVTNAGYRSDFNDDKLRFLKIGFSSSSDFGLPGAMAMLSGPVLLLRLRSAPILALTAAAGLFSLILIALSIAWMEWNARFLCLPFVLFGIAFAVATFSKPDRHRVFQAGTAFVVIWSAVSSPFLMYNERPADLWNVFHDRERLQFSECTAIRPVYDRVVQLGSAAPRTPWFLVPNENSWTLPFMARQGLGCRPTPQWSTIVDWRKKNPDEPAYVLVLDRPYQNELAAEVVNVYPEHALILQVPAEPR